MSDEVAVDIVLNEDCNWLRKYSQPQEASMKKDWDKILNQSSGRCDMG